MSLSAVKADTKIIAEIGINHNGDMDLAKGMILLAAVSGCNYAKFQKRDPDVCVPEAQKSKMRDTPWGRMTYLDYKKRIEFSGEQMRELQGYAREQGIEMFASVWDKPSVDVMAEFTRIAKIGSAKITDLDLCRQARDKFDFLIISTGMSTEEEIEACVEACRPDVIMHTNSTQPTPVEELNLRYINHLQNRWGDRAEIGQSGHEYGLTTTFAAVAMGATWVERHVTWDRTMWGSDQSSSIEPSGLFKLVKGIRDIESAMQFPPGPRRQFSGEVAKRVSLRG